VPPVTVQLRVLLLEVQLGRPAMEEDSATSLSWCALFVTLSRSLSLTGLFSVLFLSFLFFFFSFFFFFFPGSVLDPAPGVDGVAHSVLNAFPCLN